MIGQADLQEKVKTQIENDVFPRFSIFVGLKGSGKKLFIKNYITKLLNCNSIWYGIKVDDIRDMILQSHKIYEKTVFVIPDADKMSVAAKNALLKVTEEPPNNAYFILTLEDKNNTLHTIRSRGTIFNMDAYTANEIDKFYCGLDCDKTDKSHEIVKNICETPGEVLLLNKSGIEEFYDYVEKVVDNIAEVSGANSFKIADKIIFKETDEDKYDLRLFWKAFCTICLNRAENELDTKEKIRYINGVVITSKFLQDFKVNGIRKDSLFDMWLLKIREDWI